MQAPPPRRPGAGARSPAAWSAAAAAGSVVVHCPPVRPRPCVVACRRSHWCRGRVCGRPRSPVPLLGYLGAGMTSDGGRFARVALQRLPVRRSCVRCGWCRVYGCRRGGPVSGHVPRRRIPRCAGGGFAPDVRRGHPSPRGDSFGRPFVPRLGIARPRPMIRRRRVCCGACAVVCPARAPQCRVCCGPGVYGCRGFGPMAPGWPLESAAPWVRFIDGPWFSGAAATLPPAASHSSTATGPRHGWPGWGRCFRRCRGRLRSAACSRGRIAARWG